MEELWKKIESAPDYEVSNLGRVRSNKYGKSRILEQTANAKENGYLCVQLYTNGENKLRTVHSLVAEAFVPKPESKEPLQVNHIDYKDKYNNAADCLCWMSAKENCNYGDRNQKISEANKQKILGISDDGEYIVFDSINELCENLGLYMPSMVALLRNNEELKMPVQSTSDLSGRKWAFFRIGRLFDDNMNLTWECKVYRKKRKKKPEYKCPIIDSEILPYQYGGNL